MPVILVHKRQYVGRRRVGLLVMVHLWGNRWMVDSRCHLGGHCEKLRVRLSFSFWARWVVHVRRHPCYVLGGGIRCRLRGNREVVVLALWLLSPVRFIGRNWSCDLLRGLWVCRSGCVATVVSFKAKPSESPLWVAWCRTHPLDFLDHVSRVSCRSAVFLSRPGLLWVLQMRVWSRVPLSCSFCIFGRSFCSCDCPLSCGLVG